MLNEDLIKGQAGYPRRAAPRRAPWLLGEVDRRLSEEASGWGNLYLKLLPHYGSDRPRDTLLREGPGFPAPPGPCPGLRTLGILGDWRSSPPVQLPFFWLALMPPLLAAGGGAATLLPQVAPRPGTAPRAPEVPDREEAGAGDVVRSAQAPEPTARREALPGGGAEREVVRMRGTSAVGVRPESEVVSWRPGGTRRSVYSRRIGTNVRVLTHISFLLHGKKPSTHPEMSDETASPVGHEDLGSNANRILCGLRKTPVLAIGCVIRAVVPVLEYSCEDPMG